MCDYEYVMKIVRYLQVYYAEYICFIALILETFISDNM